MHSAKLDGSARLRRVLDYLIRADGKRSTLQIATGARVCAVNSCVSELRANGFAIYCRRARSLFNEPVWLYWLDRRDGPTAKAIAAYVAAHEVQHHG